MLSRISCFSYFLAAVTAVVLVPSAQSALITTGGAVPHQGLHLEDASSSLLGFGDRSAPNTINSTGLSGPVGPGQSHSTTAVHDWNSSGAPPDPLPAFITYDLGKNYALNGGGNYVKVWNGNETTARGAADVEIWVSPDENSSNLVKLVTTGANAQTNGSGNFLFPVATGGGYLGFTLDTTNLTNAGLLSNVRLMNFNVLTNRAGADQIAALSEVQFDGTLVSTPTAITKLATASVTIAAGGVGGSEAVNAVSSQLGGREAGKSRDKSGITTAGLTVGAVQHDIGAGNQWLSGDGTPPTTGSPEWITWDLGSSIILDRIHIWNYSETGGLSNRGAKDVEILVSPDTNLANLIALDNVALGGDFVFPRAVENGQYGLEIRFEDVLNSLLLNSVRLVRFRITSNYGDSNFVGIAEAEFYSTTEPYTQEVVPEPSTYALGLIGLAGLGCVALRNRNRRH